MTSLSDRCASRDWPLLTAQAWTHRKCRVPHVCPVPKAGSLPVLRLSQSGWLTLTPSPRDCVQCREGPNFAFVSEEHVGDWRMTRCWAGLVSTARSPWACEHSHHVGTEGASSRGGAPGLGSVTRGAQGRLGVQRAWGTRRPPLQGTSACCGHTSSPLRRWVVTAFTVGDTPVFSEAPRTTLTLVAVQGADKTASRCWGWTRTRARTSSRGPSLC